MRSHLLVGAALLLAPALLVPTLASAQGDYTARRIGSASAQGIQAIRIANGSGRLVVTGNPAATEVHATAIAHASSSDQLGNIRLVVQREGNDIVVRPDRSMDNLHDCNCWLDMTVEIPTSILLEVTDGSGGAELRNVGRVNVQSGSGGVRIQHTSGDVAIRSGSGEASVSDVHGSVRASSGSGGVTIDGVTGSVDIDHAGSGSVSLGNVSGSVHVGTIGSGSLDANTVGGDLTVDTKGSGSVHYASVRGKVSVPKRDW